MYQNLQETSWNKENNYWKSNEFYKINFKINVLILWSCHFVHNCWTRCPCYEHNKNMKGSTICSIQHIKSLVVRLFLYWKRQNSSELLRNGYITLTLKLIKKLNTFITVLFITMSTFVIDEKKKKRCWMHMWSIIFLHFYESNPRWYKSLENDFPLLQNRAVLCS